jgi:hypothetical protein
MTDREDNTQPTREDRMAACAFEVSVASEHIRLAHKKAEILKAKWGKCPDCGKKAYMCCGSCPRSNFFDRGPFYCDKVGDFVSAVDRCKCWRHFDCPSRRKR